MVHQPYYGQLLLQLVVTGQKAGTGDPSPTIEGQRHHDFESPVHSVQDPPDAGNRFMMKDRKCSCFGGHHRSRHRCQYREHFSAAEWPGSRALERLDRA